MRNKKKIVFITGTRADFGKLKPLMKRVETSEKFECYIFITGMHMLSKYGFTFIEVTKHNFINIHPYINQSNGTDMDIVLSNTILGFSNFIKEIKPDMIIVHGDRIEAMAGAMVGALNNVLVSHIEGGEVSGTVDELIRHAITKLSHIHFVSNRKSKQRLIQMGENKQKIFIIGTPEVDVMLSDKLPLLDDVKKYYEIPFKKFALFTYHPVTTEISNLKKDIQTIIGALKKSKQNYVGIYPNNDTGSDIILNELLTLKNNKSFRILPSFRFEAYLTLLKNAKFIIGNSSSGIREAGIYAVPSINIGTRQNNRSINPFILHVSANEKEILMSIKKLDKLRVPRSFEFGKGDSAKKFIKILLNDYIWKISKQKQFFDLSK